MKGEAAAASPGPEPATRAWFPETFLFEPLVVTGDDGEATVPVKVPDRLTTWRVLALAHSRQGGQAGAVTSFLGTLPTYVEPVTPPFLYAGDQVRLPVQVVNTTERDVSTTLRLEVRGGTLSSAGGPVQVRAGSDTVQFAGLRTSTPGKVLLRATLQGADAVEKLIPVKPAGLRQEVAKAGTLAAPRSFTLAGPADALPGTEAVRLQVFPGALGVMRAELSAAPFRGGVAEDAYLLALTGSAPGLLAKLGAPSDPGVIRELSLLATQRVMRHARAPSVDTALLLAEAALAHPDSPVLARLGERLAQQVAGAQRGDGTCEGATGWTLQRLLVATADCVRVVQASTATAPARQRATLVSVRAAGAFERNLGRVNDGYTAAAILASGGVSGTVADKLKALVKAGLVEAEDGSRYLDVPGDVVRADGRPPSVVEATALAVLALGEDPSVADLGSHLMSGYSASVGWGDGRANLVALRAATALFKEPVPPGVTITVERDGKVLAQGTMDAEAVKEVLVLEADGSGSSGSHPWTVRAEPAVPGLAYALTLVAYTPWKAPAGAGLALTQELPPVIRAGSPTELTLTAALPAGTPMVVKVPLPAGVVPDRPSLDRLVSQGTLSRFELEDGLITAHVPPLPAGVVFNARLTVVPTLAGTLQAGPATLAEEWRPGATRSFAPMTWTVGG